MTDNINSKVTVVIPTHNRPAYLKRLLGYFNSCQVNYRIVIADSSADEVKRENAQTVLSFSGLDILYVDRFASDVNGWYKWLYAINQSGSKYTAICADDDFIVPKCIDEAVEFLDKNTDYVLARGSYIAFEVAKGQDGKPQFIWRPIYPHGTNDFANPAERILSHFRDYYPTLYTVHRTHVLKMIFEQTIKHSTSNEHMDELLCSMFSLIHGKAKSLKTFYSARETISDSCSKVLSDMDNLMAAGSYNEKYEKFRKGLAIYLAQEAKTSEGEAGEIIDQGMSQYLKMHYTSRGSRIKNKLRRFQLPFGLNRKLKTVYANIKKTRQPQGLLDAFADDEDFQKMRDAVLNSEK